MERFLSVDPIPPLCPLLLPFGCQTHHLPRSVGPFCCKCRGRHSSSRQLFLSHKVLHCVQLLISGFLKNIVSFKNETELYITGVSLSGYRDALNSFVFSQLTAFYYKIATHIGDGLLHKGLETLSNLAIYYILLPHLQLSVLHS